MPERESADIERLADRFQGALLGVAIGDALGAPLEGGSTRDRASLATWVSDPPHPLRYTDDTHMTLATATSLIACRGFDAEHMAEAMAAQYEREPWRGYGVGPPHVFGEMRLGRRWEDAARALFGGAGSFGNGAAMRVAPIGLFHHQHPKRAAEVARAAAQITHTHPVGQDGAAIVAAAVAEILSQPPKEALKPRRLIARCAATHSRGAFATYCDGPARSVAVQSCLTLIRPTRTICRLMGAICRWFLDREVFALQAVCGRESRHLDHLVFRSVLSPPP